MATIEKRKNDDGSAGYRVKVRLQGYESETATFKRLTDARQWAADTEAAIRDGRYFPSRQARKHTVEDLIDRYTREVLDRKDKDGNPVKRSRIDQLRHLNWWKAQIGARRLAEVTPAVVADCKTLLTEGRATHGKHKPREDSPLRSAGTVNRYLAAMSHVMTVAAKEYHWITTNPFRQTAKLREPRGRVRFLSEVERKALLEACMAHSHPLHTIVVLALSTGARQSELLTLRWPQIDLDRGLIYLLKTKTDQRRALPLTGLAKALVEYLRTYDGTDLLFPSRRNRKKPIDIHTVFRAALAAAEITDFRFHDLRHSAASYLAMNGATLAEIAHVLGHKTLAMVQRYAHLTDQHTVVAVERMNERIFGGAA